MKNISLIVFAFFIVNISSYAQNKGWRELGDGKYVISAYTYLNNIYGDSLGNIYFLNYSTSYSSSSAIVMWDGSRFKEIKHIIFDSNIFPDSQKGFYIYGDVTETMDLATGYCKRYVLLQHWNMTTKALQEMYRSKVMDCDSAFFDSFL